MKIKNKIILVAMLTLFIASISLIAYRKFKDIKQEDPYEIKKSKILIISFSIVQEKCLPALWCSLQNKGNYTNVNLMEK